MSKIKDINERLKKTPSEFSEIRLLVAKRTLAFFMAFYFLSLYLRVICLCRSDIFRWEKMAPYDSSCCLNSVCFMRIICTYKTPFLNLIL